MLCVKHLGQVHFFFSVLSGCDPCIHTRGRSGLGRDILLGNRKTEVFSSLGSIITTDARGTCSQSKQVFDLCRSHHDDGSDVGNMTTKEESSDSFHESGSTTHSTRGGGRDRHDEVTSAAFCLRYALGDQESWTKAMGFIIPRALPYSTAAFYAVGRVVDMTRVVDVVFITRRYQKPSYVSDAKRWTGRGATGQILSLDSPSEREKRESFIDDCLRRMLQTPHEEVAGSVEDLKMELRELLKLRRRYHRYRDRRRKARPQPLPSPPPPSPSEGSSPRVPYVESLTPGDVLFEESGMTEAELDLLCQFIVDDEEEGMENTMTLD